MPQQYHAADADSGLEVEVTGEFPPDPDDRVRIARTTNLFTRLMATILTTENDYERRERFKAIETQLELADALIRGDAAEVQSLIRSTLSSMGVTEEQLQQAQEQIRSQLESMGGDPGALEALFGEGETDDLPSLEDLGPLEGLFEGGSDQPPGAAGGAEPSEDTPSVEEPPDDPAPSDRPPDAPL